MAAARESAMQQQLQPVLNQLLAIQQQMTTLASAPADPAAPTNRDLQAAAASINQATTLVQGILSQPGV